MIGNLHTLLNRPWYIHGDSADALLPALFSIMEGNAITAEIKNPNTYMGLTTSGDMIAADESGVISSQDQYVLVYNIKSPIYKYDQPCGPSGTRTLMSLLDTAEIDDNCAGVVLDGDTGGGQVAGTGEAYDRIVAFQKTKPLVGYTDGYLCSAGYYLFSGASEIIANKRASHIGSIGVMFSGVDLKGAIEKKGGKVITEYSDLSPKKNRAARAMAEGDSSILIKEELNPSAEEFHSDMRMVRPQIKPEALEGDTYRASAALEMGLVDRIGTLQDAVDAVFTLSRKRDTTSNQFNSNINTTMKTTDRPLLQAAMGLDEALASLEDHSSLSNEQLDTIEAHLATQAEAVTTAADQVTAAQTATTDTQATVTDMTASLDALISVNGLDVAADATQEQKFTAVQGHITTLGARKAANPTVTRVDANETQTTQDYTMPGMDIDAALNN